MAKLNAARQAQYPLTAEFTFSFDDTMVNVAGALDGFATVGSHVFDVINLPAYAIVTGGDVTTESAVTGATAFNISVGDSTTANRYLNAANRVAAGISPLVATGYLGAGENIRLTVAPTVGTATAGKVTLRVTYVIRGRGNEVQSS